MRARHPQPPPARKLSPAIAPPGSALDDVEALAETARVHLQVVDRAVRSVDQVRASHRERIEPQLAGHRVEHRLERVAHVDRAVAAHRAVGRRVRVDAEAVVARRRHPVDRVQERARVEDRDEPVARVGAAALHDLRLDRRDSARLREADLQPHVGLRPPAMREERLLARELEPHRSARRAREEPGDDLEVERLGAVAEAAADERLDDADRRLVELQAAGERQVHVVGHLRDRVEREPAALGVPVGHRRVRLHHRVVDLRVVERVLAHEVRLREPAVHVAEGLLDRALEVARLAFVQRHGALCASRLRVEIRGQRLEVELDRREGRLRRRGVVGGDGGHRLAAIAHAIARERVLVLRDRDHAVGDRAVLAGDDRPHARHRARARRVDAADARVRDRAPQDRADERAARREVRRVAGGAGHLLDAVDERLAHAHRLRRRRALRFRVHRAPPAAACTASMIFT